MRKVIPITLLVSLLASNIACNRDVKTLIAEAKCLASGVKATAEDIGTTAKKMNTDGIISSTDLDKVHKGYNIVLKAHNTFLDSVVSLEKLYNAGMTNLDPKEVIKNRKVMVAALMELQTLLPKGK